MALPIELQQNEQVVKLYQRHPIFLYRQLALIVAAGIIPILLYNWIFGGMNNFLGDFASTFTILWAIGAAVAGFIAWYSYKHDLWILTNQRIVDITKRNWFNTTISTADLINLLDITIQQRGILATMFHFGDVQCQTAGGPNLFVMRGVPNPKEALTLVDTTRDQARIDQKHT